jgi:tetratricopeptide (TPR) repeat protein
VLATSRELLNLREEWLHPLSGMSFPVEETTSERLESYSAVQFFVQCARQMQPGFDLAADATAVVRICCLVEGMPLSIELATTWLRLFPCEQVAREVEQSLDFLTTSARNVPARHRSMKAVFEHSWRLLSEEEQTVLRRLSIFRGGFDRTAAQQVAGASFPLLVTLTEKSLIQIGSGERYQMHELLRQFAEEKLRTDLGEYEQVQDDHCHYYLTWLSQQESRLKGREHLAAVVEIETEIENVRAAWAWAVTHDDLDAIERSLEGLAYFYETKLWQDQSIILFQKAIAVLTERPHEDRRQILLAMILAKQGIAYGHLSAEGGKFALLRIREQLENCLTLLQRFGEIKATAEIYLAFFWLVESPQQRLLLWLRALAIYERRGDRWKMAHTFEGLGFFANLLGHYEEAKHYYQCGLALCEELGDRLLLANIQALLAEVHRALGEYEEAIRLAGASLVSRTEIGNQRGIAFSLYVLGTIASRMGNLEDALRYSRQSRETFTEIGLLGGIDYALSNLGHIATAMGDYAEARRQFHKILQSSLARDVLSIHLPVPLALVGMAEVLCQEGQPEAAIELVEQVLRRPNAWQETKDRAIKLLAELQATVPPAVSAEAQARGRTTDLHTTVVRLLGVTPA